MSLRAGPTPVEQVDDRLWIKRDDLTADPIGGNKVRALELLLGGISHGAPILTGGSRGSTHVLSTAVHGRRAGLEIEAASWPQEMNETAKLVDARLDGEIARRHFRSPVTAALWLTWQAWRGRRVIPAGGSSPLGIIGHVNAAFELAQQVRDGAMPAPDAVVVPLGTGGTAAGLALGFHLAGVQTRVVGARVVPKVIGRASRVRRLARRTLALMQRVTGERIATGAIDVEVVEDVYGGAYGRPLPGAPAATASGIPLDPTYSAKAFVAATESARQVNTLFWLTFDSRWIRHE